MKFIIPTILILIFAVGCSTTNHSALDYFPHRKDLPQDSSYTNVMPFMHASPISTSPPSIPPSTPKRRYEAMVAFIIETDGTIKEAELMQRTGIPALDQSIIECVQSWIYKPTISGGSPISTVARIPITIDNRG